MEPTKKKSYSRAHLLFKKGGDAAPPRPGDRHDRRGAGRERGRHGAGAGEEDEERRRRRRREDEERARPPPRAKPPLPPPPQQQQAAAAVAAGPVDFDAPHMIEVRLDDRLGKRVRVKVNSDDTVRTLKLLAAAQLGTRPDRIRFQRASVTLKDPIMLSDYEIHNGTNLELYYN